MEKLVARITLSSLRHPWRFLFGALLCTAVSIWLASGLEVRSSFEELLPGDVASVRNVKELIKHVGGDGTILLSVENENGSANLAAAKAMAPKLAQEVLALGPNEIRSVEYSFGAEESYFAGHWPLFLSTEQLQQAYTTLDSEIEKRKQSALDLGLGEDEAPDAGGANADGGFEAWIAQTPRERVQARFARYDDGFLVHPDKTSLAIVIRPTGTSLGVSETRALLDRIGRIIDSHHDELAAAKLRVGEGGTFPLFLAEYETILHDVASTALLCITLVLGSLLLFYRELRSTISLGAAVLMAVAMTFGITRLVIGYLNTQTAFLGSIVVGNGINYGLIYLARVRQLRRAGVALEPAVLEGAQTAARATLLASAASSVSFAVLIAAANRGFRHFGIIGGIGMLLCWTFTFTLVPAQLALWEKLHAVRPAKTAGHAREPPPALQKLFANSRAIVALFVVAALISVALFVARIPDAIERNLENLTNELKGATFTELVRDNKRANEALGQSSAGAIALLPNEDDAEQFCRVVDARAREPRYAVEVQSCDTLASIVPSHQREKLAWIARLHDRLNNAVIGWFPPATQTKLREIKADLGAQRELTLADAPPALTDRFRQRDGSYGRMAVVTARSDAKLEHGPNLQAFVDAIRTVPVGGINYDAAGENVVFADLLHDIAIEGPLTTFGSLLGVCVLVAFAFRKVRASGEVIAALVTGVLLMGGVATLLHIKINFFNFIVFPITFGIAVDYGANVLVRVQQREGRVVEALAEVGPAVALCSWTSIIGYGSLTIALNRALQSFGWYALVGELTSILAALVFLPALALRLNPFTKK